MLLLLFERRDLVSTVIACSPDGYFAGTQTEENIIDQLVEVTMAMNEDINRDVIHSVASTISLNILIFLDN